MTYYFVYDLHLGAPNQLEGRYVIDWADERMIYGGDNLDLANCLKKHSNSLQFAVDQAKKFAGWRFKSGNHERQKDFDYLTKIPNSRVGYMHGDLIFWGWEKSKAYRAKDHGAGFLKRTFWVNALDALENGYDRKISSEDLDRFYDIAVANDVDEIIVGHLHPKQILRVNYKGKILTVCPRGITALEIAQK